MSVTATLAPDVVAVLAREPSGVSCDELARRVRRRRCDVLATLRADPVRFTHVGCRRGSRWRLAQTARDGFRDDEPGRDVLDVGGSSAT